MLEKRTWSAACSSEQELRRLAMLPNLLEGLAPVAFGWGYYLTETGAILEPRARHVAFVLLFSLGWVALGIGLWVRGRNEPENPNASSWLRRERLPSRHLAQGC
jgi:hypothetical protein